MSVPRRYGLLRVIAFIIRLLAWLVLLAGIGGALWTLIVQSRSAAPLPYLTAILIVGLPLVALTIFVQVFAFGSILSMLINIEESTRALAFEGERAANARS